MKQIFPKEIVENTIEVHQFKHTTKSKLIYTLLLLALLVAIVLLPFVNVKIYNNALGIIKPDKERAFIQNINTGKVVFSNLKNNLNVVKGDTLLVINSSSLEDQLNKNSYQIDEIKSFITDINVLLEGRRKKLQSLKFIQEVAVYRQKISELQIRYVKVSEDFNRNKKLHEKGVIAQIAFTNSKLDYDLAKQAIVQYRKQQHNTWQSQLVSYQNQLKDLESNQTQLQQNKDLTVVKAPFSGTVLNAKGIETGSLVTAGTQLAELSPKADLIVECYISPNDVGLLKKENNVNFQVGAFNYNQWGLATGKIVDIANDVQFINNAPMFRVLCSLDQDYLQLKNGFKGYFKKGMTLNARFEITQRSVFHLLYDKVDDWLNPTTQIVKETKY